MAGLHASTRQEGSTPCLGLLEVGNGRPGSRIICYDDVLDTSTQSRINGYLVVSRHLNQVCHCPFNSLQLLFTLHNGFDACIITRIVCLELGQGLDLSIQHLALTLKLEEFGLQGFTLAIALAQLFIEGLEGLTGTSLSLTTAFVALLSLKVLTL